MLSRSGLSGLASAVMAGNSQVFRYPLGAGSPSIPIPPDFGQVFRYLEREMAKYSDRGWDKLAKYSDTESPKRSANPGIQLLEEKAGLAPVSHPKPLPGSRKGHVEEVALLVQEGFSV